MLDTQAQDVPALALGTERQGRVVSGNTGCVDAGVLSPQVAGMGVLQEGVERGSPLPRGSQGFRGEYSTAVCSLRAGAVFLS